LNDRARLRFDFSHFAGVAEEELAEIESLVNAQVLANTPVVTLVDVPIDEAVQTLGAMALFWREVWGQGAGGADWGVLD